MNSIIKSDVDYIISNNLDWHTFDGKVVLVSGAAGFLASYMVDVLLALRISAGVNVRVIGLVRNLAKAQERFRHHHENSLSLITADVCNEIHVDGPVDYIIHAASIATPKIFGADPVGTILPNVLGTRNLLELARQKGTKNFLYFSTSGVYGFVGEDKYPIKEDVFGALDPMKPETCYLESKRMGENLCVSWMKQYGTQVKVVRPAITYGPGISLDDGRSFADFIANIVERKNIVLYSDGAAIRNYCYIADAIFGIFLVLLRGEAGSAYNVASPEEISVAALAQYLVSEVFPERELQVIFSHAPSKNFMRMNFARTTVEVSKLEKLGWRMSFSIKDGFKRAVQSFEE